MEQAGIDIDLSLSILNDYNAGRVGRTPPVVPEGVPGVDGRRVIDLRSTESFTFTADEISGFRQRFPEAAARLSLSGETVSLTAEELRETGIRLYPFFAYGFLNGGSATSYADRKKNREFNEDLFRLYEPVFTPMAEQARGRPKGTTPGFIQPDGTPGPSYMELKLRSLLLQSRSCMDLTGNREIGKIPFFQMTSVSNDRSVRDALKEYQNSPWLKQLAEETDHPVWSGESGIQPMITAYTHSEDGSTKTIFHPAGGEESTVLPLPGGHGQCFRVLEPVLRKLHERGIRFISLGNIDNLGYTADPLSLALLAIKGNPAGFDFSFRTPVDVKGGILIEEAGGQLNCVDLGVGISHEEAARLEEQGYRILFNCATGLFDLTWLLENLERIKKELPLRFSDQNKDTGRYSQAEQVTWEVIGMMENPLIFGIDKYKRFLAAKMLMENLLTSGLSLDSPGFPEQDKSGGLHETAVRLHRGLGDLLRSQYGLVLKNNRWRPEEET